ncbi:hypothetical protein KC345_g144 [Hortaea werneckii]|nr:hypothetical protein KC345_g144 [Hortaea werneckii]
MSSRVTLGDGGKLCGLRERAVRFLSMARKGTVIASNSYVARMLIGICGGICAGKHSIQDFLIREHNFTPLHLTRIETPGIEKSASGSTVPNGDSSQPNGTLNSQTFATAEALVDHATKNWQANFVTTSIYDETIVEALAHRPFFILVHIDAPISIRWQRFRDRCATASLTPPSLEHGTRLAGPDQTAELDHFAWPFTRFATLPQPDRPIADPTGLGSLLHDPRLPRGPPVELHAEAARDTTGPRGTSPTAMTAAVRDVTTPRPAKEGWP